MSMFQRAVLAAGLAVMATGVVAWGEGPVVIQGVEFAEPPSAMSIETDDGWRFEPAFSGGEMVGMLAVYSGTGGTPASIRIAWFEPAGGGEWAAWGWQDATEVAAAAYLVWFFADAEMFTHSGELTGVDWEQIAAAEAPVPLRLGFDESEPFQPVLGELEPATAEAIVAAGGAGMPVLAPLALPAAAGAGGFTLTCVLGEFDQAFVEFAEVTDLIDDQGVGAGAGCGPVGQTCIPSTTRYRFADVCTPWSPWVINVGGLCERDRSCQTKTKVLVIHTDCSTTESWEYGTPKPQTATKPASTRPDGSKYCS